ncbi:MAG: YraN family protein [Chloroflexota bacterium]
MKRATGDFGEDLAAHYLQQAGLTVLDRNFRCQAGEIDLIAQDQTELVFVEVRTRSGSAFGTPEDSVTARKRRKMAECALSYLAEHQARGRPWRVDLVAVELDNGRVVRVAHYKHVLQD